jgi:UDP-N-acetylglucosamine diphosphorylase / glucose-1-phosphate thymidylyltransferase / UDP-N-acetylgalactosamine diphosphorylase / glucosamine-1-phosphate N-acetyltransferase / galactosamine-1-phosphate N-acetyltransferase
MLSHNFSEHLPMTSNLLGIIPAAGSGIRARPYTYEQHKGMFLIDGKPNLERIMDTMQNELGIDEVVVVLGYKGDTIRDHFGDGSSRDLRINYVENQNLDKGWAWSVLLAKPFLADRRGCVMLADEFYLGANFGELNSFPFDDYSVVCMVKETDNPDLIKRNFSVERSGNRIVRLVEKPISVPNNILGMATFILAPDVFNLLEKAYEAGRTSVEFVNFVDGLIRDGHQVAPFDLCGDYINLNDVASLEAAQDLAIRRRLSGMPK